MTKIAVLLAALALCLPAVARAADDAPQGPCKADREKFCKDVKPGEGRIIACMKEHESDLSEGCKAKMAEGKKKMEQAKADFDNACGGDVKSLCADVKAGHGAILKCLKQNKEKVSEGCKSFVAEKRQERRERRKARRAARQDGDQGSDSGAQAPAGDSGGSDAGGSQE